MKYEVGIDFGSISSFVYLYRDNLPEPIIDIQGEIQIPSYVCFDGVKVFVGSAAKQKMDGNHLVIRNVKKLIGKLYCSFSHEEDYEIYGTKLQEDKIGYCNFIIQNEMYSVTDIISYILDFIRRRVNYQSGVEVTNVVMSVPINASNLYREIMTNAAMQAGWRTIQLVNEPTAALISQQNTASLEGNILVFQLTDTYLCNTILRKKDDKLEVLSTITDETVNDSTIENALLNHVENEYRLKTSHNIWSDDPLKQVREKATTLGDIHSSIHELSCYPASDLDITRNHQTMTLKITQDCFNSCLKSIIEKIQSNFKYLLKYSCVPLTSKDINSVLLVGDSSFIPIINQTVQDAFSNSTFIKTLKYGELLAYSCGYCALHKLDPDIHTQSYLHSSIGLVIQNQIIYPLFKTGSELPCQKVLSLTLMKKGVNTFDIQVVEMDEWDQNSIRMIASLKSSHFTVQPDEQKELSITFSMNQKGVFSIVALTYPDRQECINTKLQCFSHYYVC